MVKHYDLVILGGGCAGLSLAMRLAEAGSLTPSTLILEKRAQYTNDRTWCFWDVASPALKDWVDYAWSDFQIKNGHKSFTRSCIKNPYLMLTARTFYQRAIAKIALNNRVTLSSNQKIISVNKTTQHKWQINTQTASYTADRVVDTRPNTSASNSDSILWQLFEGAEVEANGNVFDPTQFILMDFDNTFTQGLGFIYLLPFSTTRALVEYTVFSNKVIPADKLKECLANALQVYLKNVDYQIVRTECGQLPMGNQKIKKSDDASYIYAGLFAGAARPSSGYAFQRIQSWSIECASALIERGSLQAPKKDKPVMAVMDGIFLKVLQSNFLDAKSHQSIALFFNLFKECNSNTLARFLSDRATFFDCIAIIVAMPKYVFLKAVPLHLFDLLVKYKK